MKRDLLVISVMMALFSPVPGVGQTDIQAILADSSRPQGDRARDAGRKPDQVVEFFDIGPGDRVADLLAGGGYYTRILVPLVGEDGEVYAGNNP